MHIAPYLVPFMRANADLTVNMQLTDEMVDIVGMVTILLSGSRNFPIQHSSHVA